MTKFILLAILSTLITVIYPSWGCENPDIDQLMQEIKSPTCLYQPPVHNFHEQTSFSQASTSIMPGAMFYLTMFYMLTEQTPKLEHLSSKDVRRHHKNYNFYDHINEKPPYTPPPRYLSKKSHKRQNYR